MAYPKQVWEYDKEELAEMYALAQSEIERLRAALRRIAEWKDNNIWPAEETRDAMRELAARTLNEQSPVKPDSSALGKMGHSGATENTGTTSKDAAVRPANSLDDPSHPWMIRDR